jgi:predicted nucleotidyltransferase
MIKQDIQQTLALYFTGQPIDKAWLFGSYSRKEANGQSDIDILVRFVPDSRITLFKYARMVNDLQKLLHKKIDLVEDGQLFDYVEENVQRDKILIYERKN